MAVGGVRRRVGQGHAGKRVQVAQAAACQLQAQVQRPQVQRIGQGAGQCDLGVSNAHLRLQRERLVGVTQRQQATDFAGAVEFLAVVLAVDLQGKGVVLRHSALVLALFRFFFADDLAKRDRFTQRVDQHVETGFQGLVVQRHLAFIKADCANVHFPVGGLGVRVGGVEREGPVCPPIGQAFEFGFGLLQVNTRDGHGLAQQRQR